MGGPVDRKALSVELYEVTGEAVPESDPIVTGALFFSYKIGEAGRLAEESVRAAALVAAADIREAGRLAAEEIREATCQSALSSAEAVISAEQATRSASLAIEKLVADRTQLFRSVDSHMAKCVKLASQGQSNATGFRTVPVWYALSGAVAIGIALAAALAIGFERGSAQADDAAVGRSFVRVVPTMDAKLKQQLMEHLRKPSQ